MMKCIFMLLKTTLNTSACVCVCVGEFSSWKIASLLGNNTWTIGCTWLPTMTTKSLAVIQPFKVQDQQNTKYCCPNHHRSSSMFHSWNQALRITGFLGWCPNINPALCWEQREGWLIWPYYVFSIIRWPGFMIITPSFSYFRAVFSNQRFSSTMDVGFVKLPSDFLWNQSSRWISSSAVTFAAVLLWFTDTLLFNVQRSLSLGFGFWPLFLLDDDVLPWFVYVIITLETAALDTPNKVTVSLQMLQLNMHQQSVLFENLRRLSFCSTYKLLLNTICNPLTLALHSTN